MLSRFQTSNAYNRKQNMGKTPQQSSRVGALVKPLPPFLGLEPENVIVRRLITQLVLTDCYCPPPTHTQYSTVLTRMASIRKVLKPQKSSSYMLGGNLRKCKY